jgi:hypothetical protein
MFEVSEVSVSQVESCSCPSYVGLLRYHSLTFFYFSLQMQMQNCNTTVDLCLWHHLLVVLRGHHLGVQPVLHHLSHPH